MLVCGGAHEVLFQTTRYVSSSKETTTTRLHKWSVKGLVLVEVEKWSHRHRPCPNAQWSPAPTRSTPHTGPETPPRISTPGHG